MLRRLKVLVKGQTVAVAGLALVLLGILLGAGHDTSLLVVTDPLLEEVGLTSQGDTLHEVKRIGSVEVLLVAESDQETVSNKFNVLAHEHSVHAQERARKSISQELLLDSDSLDDDVLNNFLGWAPVKVREEQTGKVSVKTLITRDELVGEGKTGHQASLLQPEN